MRVYLMWKHPSFSMQQQQQQQEEEQVIVFKENEVVLLDNLTVQDIALLDKDVFDSVEMLLNNKFSDAIQFLNKKADKDAMHAIGVGFMLFLKAISTFNKEDMDSALAALELAINVATVQNTTKSAGVVSKLTSFLPTFTDTAYTHISARSTMIIATGNVLSALLYLLQESVAGLIKGGIYITKGNNSVEDVFKWYSKIPQQEIGNTIDANSEGALLFLRGILMVAIAGLPPKIIRLISFFGFNGDREMGYALMKACEQGTHLYSKIVPIFLLGVYALLISCAPGIQPEAQLQDMQDRLDGCLKVYPNCIFYLNIASRFNRVNRQLPKAIQVSTKAVNAQAEWPGLTCLGKYEWLMNLLFSAQYAEAASVAEDLKKESFWSKAFFAYCQVAAMDMLQTGKMAMYKEAVTFINSEKFGGKGFPIEKFIVKKVEYFSTLPDDDIRWLFLPGLELSWLFLGFSFMSRNGLEEGLERVNNAIAKASGYQNQHLTNHLNILKGCLIRNINICNKTYDLSLLAMFDFEKDDMEWTRPYSIFEQGQLYLDAYFISKNQLYLDQAKTLLNKANEYSNYVLEFRLGIRIKLVLDQIQMIEKELNCQ